MRTKEGCRTEALISNQKQSEPDIEFFNRILLDPADTCDELLIVSGYASSSMLKRHLDILDQKLKPKGKTIRIQLIIGMASEDCISYVEHEAFKDLVKKHPNVKCSYTMTNAIPCHAKLYIWRRNGVPVLAFSGSANYSQNAFFGKRAEAMVKCDPQSALEFYESIEPESASCDFNEIEDAVMIVSENKFRREIDEMKKTPTDKKKYVDLPLVDREGKVGSRSGLNWGQRPNRDPNQAYIPIPASIGRKNFFPPKGTVFTVMTDDGFVFQCVTAQNEKGRVPKAIETSNDNSELGAYFRRRLEVGSGEVVKTEDLDRYGRKTVTFIDLGDGSYYMDFSIPRGHNENLS